MRTQVTHEPHPPPDALEHSPPSKEPPSGYAAKPPPSRSLLTDIPHGADCYPSRAAWTPLTELTDIPQESFP